MGKSDANRTGLAFVEEATWGLFPASAGTPLTDLRFTGESLSYNITNTQSAEIRDDRQITDLVQFQGNLVQHVPFGEQADQAPLVFDQQAGDVEFDEAFQGLTIEVGTRLAGWVTANNRPLYNVHPGPDTIGLEDEMRDCYQNSILVPLVHEDRPLGTIALYQTDHERYSDDHIRRLEIIANRASIALYNAIRFEETQEDAFTDRLTGLLPGAAISHFNEQVDDQALKKTRSTILHCF